MTFTPAEEKNIILRLNALERGAWSPVALNELYAARTLTGGVSTNIPLTVVPTGKMVQFVIPFVVRPPALGVWAGAGDYHYVNAQIFDGTTHVGSDQVGAGIPTGSAYPVALTAAVSGVIFAATPVLRLFATADTQLDTLRLLGMAWA